MASRFDHAPNLPGSLGHNPNASMDEMLEFRGKFNVREHLRENPPAPPVDPTLIHLSKETLKMLCERAGLDVIDTGAPGQSGGRKDNLEEQLELLKQNNEMLIARCSRLVADNGELRIISDKMAAHMITLDGEITNLKSELLALQTLNTEAPRATEENTNGTT